ncbi:hypothetical protein [Streptomyces sp. NRRL F-2664]|uniref:hypothetical protein n=1 Tax=Streptomyces sp. NRRL F-2664 TaxID=1463842 RepID=UPI001F43A26A|nr:hypothetical protein [Streptomyces sp. NRRL F-2664]
MGRSSARIANSARPAAARSAADLPGTRPEASHARLCPICRTARPSPAATTTDTVRPAGRYNHRPDASRSTLLPSTYRPPAARAAETPSAVIPLDSTPTAGAANCDNGA